MPCKDNCSRKHQKPGATPRPSATKETQRPEVFSREPKQLWLSNWSPCLALLIPSLALCLFRYTSRPIGNKHVSGQAASAGWSAPTSSEAGGAVSALACSPHSSLKCLFCGWLSLERFFQLRRPAMVKSIRSCSRGCGSVHELQSAWSKVTASAVGHAAVGTTPCYPVSVCLSSSIDGNLSKQQTSLGLTRASPQVNFRIICAKAQLLPTSSRTKNICASLLHLPLFLCSFHRSFCSFCSLASFIRSFTRREPSPALWAAGL